MHARLFHSKHVMRCASVDKDVLSQHCSFDIIACLRRIGINGFQFLLTSVLQMRFQTSADYGQALAYQIAVANFFLGNCRALHASIAAKHACRPRVYDVSSQQLSPGVMPHHLLRRGQAAQGAAAARINGGKKTRRHCLGMRADTKAPLLFIITLRGSSPRSASIAASAMPHRRLGSLPQAFYAGMARDAYWIQLPAA